MFGELEYIGLFCVESPEIRFEDTVIVVLNDPQTIVEIDPVFLDICVPDSLLVVSTSPDKPVAVGSRISGSKVIITADPQALATRKPLRVIVRLSGIRAGTQDVRFPRYTKRQMEKNNRFWGQALEEDK